MSISAASSAPAYPNNRLSPPSAFTPTSTGGEDDGRAEAVGPVVAVDVDPAAPLPSSAASPVVSTTMQESGLPGHGSLSPPLPPPAQEALARMEQKMKNATIHISVEPTKAIHRFPQSLRQIGDEVRYVVPSVVAIGPYHHGLRHLQEMEEIKHAAAVQFCEFLGRSVEEVYGRIFSIASEARMCYTTPLMISDAEFAEMMFLDGCFLLNLVALGGHPLTGRSVSCWPTIAKDILLLENQIPWLVLEALTECCNLKPMGIFSFWVDSMFKMYFLDEKQEKTTPFSDVLTNYQWRPVQLEEEDAKTPHLLGLLRLRMTCDMAPLIERRYLISYSLLQVRLSTSDLSQIGLKLTASKASGFAKIDIRKIPLLFGELSLSPLFLNEIVAHILVNVVALEVVQVQATNASDDELEEDGSVVSSYLSVMATLMNREEDVQQLRERGVLCAHYSNAQTLAFFKGLAPHLRLGYNYFAIMHEIDGYIRQRPVRIAVHRFVYNNFKIIASVLSIAGVLVGIFKALYSAKRP